MTRIMPARTELPVTVAAPTNLWRPILPTRTEPQAEPRTEHRTEHRTELPVMVADQTMEEWWRCLTTRLEETGRSKLHDEIVTLCASEKLTPEQMWARNLAMDYITQAVLEIWPTAKVHLYGSTAAGLALPSSDIDIAVTKSTGKRSIVNSRNPDPAWCVSVLKEKLIQRNDHPFQSLIEIPYSKVPILKARFKSGLLADVSFDWDGRRTSRTVKAVTDFVQNNAALQPLCIVLKKFLRQLNLNDLFTGGIGSFCLTVMIVSHLQNLGSLKCANLDDYGALLLSFFTRYSVVHDYRTDVVCVTPGKYISKEARGWACPTSPDLLAVESPVDPRSDIGAASYNIHEVRTKFLQAKFELEKYWNDEYPFESMLKVCTGQGYMIQRLPS